MRVGFQVRRRRHVLLIVALTTLASIALSVTAMDVTAFGLDFPARLNCLMVAFVVPALATPVSSYWVVDALRINVQLRERLEALVRIDDLTGVNNRRTFLAEAERESIRAQRLNTVLAVVAIDLDRFKQVNDEHGHAVGDAVLADAARAIHGSAREAVDIVGRVGGEEFAVLLPRADAGEAFMAAQRICRAIAAGRVDTERGQVRVTASAGVAVFDCQETFPAALKRADDALREAKRQGRNRIIESTAGPVPKPARRSTAAILDGEPLQGPWPRQKMA